MPRVPARDLPLTPWPLVPVEVGTVRETLLEGSVECWEGQEGPKALSTPQAQGKPMQKCPLSFPRQRRSGTGEM